MPVQSLTFKRLVIGLQPNAGDRSLRFAAELAEMLQLELLGLFLEDNSLRDLAQIPFVREFRGPAVGWQPIDIERVSRDLEHAAASLKRIFERATQELEIAVRFEVARGSLAESIRAVTRAGDIIVLFEPRNPAERATSQFAWLSEAAHRSAAAVLQVPSRIRRSRGPIVAIAAEPNDPSVHAAARLAIAAKEELVIIDADHHVGLDAYSRELATETRLKVRQITAARATFLDPAACGHSFGQLQERLVVMSRSAFDPRVASMIAAVRQVPVLLIGPARNAGGVDTKSTAA